MRTKETVCCKDGKYRSCEDIFGEDIEDQSTTEVEGGSNKSGGSKKESIGSNKKTQGGNKDAQPNNASSTSTSLTATADNNSNKVSAASISSPIADKTTSGSGKSSYSF